MTEQGSGGSEKVGGDGKDGRTWYEEFTITGSELLEKVKQLIKEGNVRRVFIKNSEGATILEIPLTAGVAIAAVATIAAPVLVAVGAVAALLTHATVGVERSEAEGDQPVSDAPVSDAPVSDAPGTGSADQPTS